MALSVLVKSDVIGGQAQCNEWSVPMQSGGQVECNFAGSKAIASSRKRLAALSNRDEQGTGLPISQTATSD